MCGRRKPRELLSQWFFLPGVFSNSHRCSCPNSVRTSSLLAVEHQFWKPFSDPVCEHWSVILRLRVQKSLPRCRGHQRGPVDLGGSYSAACDRRRSSSVDCVTSRHLQQNQTFSQPTATPSRDSRPSSIPCILQRTVMCVRAADHGKVLYSIAGSRRLRTSRLMVSATAVASHCEIELLSLVCHRPHGHRQAHGCGWCRTSLIQVSKHNLAFSGFKTHDRFVLSPWWLHC